MQALSLTASASTPSDLNSFLGTQHRQRPSRNAGRGGRGRRGAPLQVEGDEVGATVDHHTELDKVTPQLPGDDSRNLEADGGLARRVERVAEAIKVGRAVVLEHEGPRLISLVEVREHIFGKLLGEGDGIQGFGVWGGLLFSQLPSSSPGDDLAKL